MRIFVCALAIAGGMALLQSLVAAQAGEEAGSPSAIIDAMNAELAGIASNVRVDQAELFVHGASWDGSATTIVANNRQHRLSSQFVERDPRRGGFADISYLVDQSDGSALERTTPTTVVALPNAVTEAAIDRSMLRWQNQPQCPGPAVTKISDSGADPDLVDASVFQNLALLGTPFADITHAGWLPREFFDRLAPPEGSRFILGVTFTFIFVDDAGNPTDIDRNGRADVAFREIYYNRRFPWTANAANALSIHIDTVATHEAGHAFGLGHFGKVFLTADGRIQFAPRAVMNAVYVSPFADLAGTDNASFCSIWANSH